MAKNNSLKKKLKAAQRRRDRRPAAVAPATQSQSNRGSQPRVDPIERVTATILQYIDDCEDEVRDVIVVSAIRTCLNGSGAAGNQSGPLAERLERIARDETVGRRKFREALSQLRELAADHRDPKDTSAFIRYLALLSS